MKDRGRRLAFDYGSSRIGVAVCDPDAILATPLPFIPNKGKIASAITALLDEYQPISIYVGRPTHLAGNASATLEQVEKFSSLIQTLTDVPVSFIDERLTTVSASKMLTEAGVSTKDQRNIIDSMAAVTILESAIASL